MQRCIFVFRHTLRQHPIRRLRPRLRPCLVVPQHCTRRHSGSMPTTRSAKARSISHQERTASEPRSNDLHKATIGQVTAVNDRIKTFRFDIVDKNGFNVLSAPFPSPLSTCADG